MYETILVPLDGSERAEVILPHVEDLARRLGSRLVLLRVVDPAASISGMEGLPMEVARDLVQQETEESTRYLEARQADLSARSIQATISVLYGPVVHTIIDAAEKEGADLIAIASHGRTGLARMFYGSVASGVLNRVDRPLLLIRAGDS